jgi:hypothetical protein
VTRLLTAIGFLVAVTLVTATAAAAGWAPVQASHFDGRSPDTIDAASAAHSLARFHPSTSQSRARLIGQGYLDGSLYKESLPDGRSPDTKDAAAAAHVDPAPVIILGASGFDWTDAGIGAAAGFGLAIIAAAALALTRSRRPLANA